MALVAVVLLGTFFRIDGIGTKSMSHPEMWVPLIPLTVDLADPPARHTFFDLIDYNLGKDTHPPGDYIMMWLWMKLFGASEWAIRLPSVFFGVGAIALVYRLGALSGRPIAGLLGAALVAFNGYLIDWSGIGRMYAGAGFFALLSSVLLLQMCQKPDRARGWTGLWYFLSVFAGLSFHVLVWPIIVAQILWPLWNARNQNKPIPEFWNVQVAAFLAASPLITFAVYQSHHPVATLSRKFWIFGRELLEFGFLLPARGIADLHSTVPPALWDSVWGASPLSFLRILFFLVSAALFIAGLRAAGRTAIETPDREPNHNFWFGVWAVAGGGALLLSAAFLWVVHRKSVPIEGTVAAALLPIPLAAISLLAHRVWNRLPAPKSDRSVGLIAALAVAPFVVMMAVCVAKPVFSPRELIMVMPFVLLALALGIEPLLRNRKAAAVVLVLLAYLHFESIRAYRPMIIGTDFRLWANRAKPFVQPDDLIFINRTWYGTPLLYYIHRPQYKVFAQDFSEVEQNHRGARIWWFSSRKEKMPPPMQEALANYREEMRVTSGMATSTLYVLANR